MKTSRAVHSVMGGNLGRRCHIEFADVGGGDTLRDRGGSGECSGPGFEFVAGLGTETFRSRGCEEEGRARGIVPEEMSENSVGGAKMVAGDNRGLNLTLDTQSSSRFAAGQF